MTSARKHSTWTAENGINNVTFTLILICTKRNAEIEIRNDEIYDEKKGGKNEIEKNMI